MPHRLIGRLIVVVILDAATLLALSLILPGFTLRGPGAALGLSAGLALANALLWPALVRIALPFTVLTLGVGALLLNAGVLLGIDALAAPVELRGLGSSLVVILGFTLLTTAVSGVLALDRGDLWHTEVIRRQLRRSRLESGDADTPGLLMLEIDGLGHDVLRRALRDGNVPTLAGWARDGGYVLHPWETDWSSQTGACQAGLLHGDNSDMPAFRWWEKDRDRAIVTNFPRDAAELERRHSDGRGLLHADGASRANILSGDAPHSMLTMSTVLDRDRPGRLGQDYFAYFASPYGTARTALRSVGEVVIERFGAVQQRRRDIRPRVHRGWRYALVRAYATVVQLDLQVAAVTADVLAGRPVIYTTFLAYDEVAHHSGVERADTLAVLRRVDRAIHFIAKAIESAPRPYRVVVLSDHGQSQGATFRQRYGEGLEEIVEQFGGGEIRAELTGGAEGRASLDASFEELGSRPTAVGHAMRAAAPKPVQDDKPGVPDVSVMASGNLGLISFPREAGRVTLERVEALRPGLVDALRAHPGIGFVLIRSDVHGGAVVLGPAGSRRLSDDAIEGEDPLAAFGPNAADHVRRTDAFPHCPDILVNSRYWEDLDEVAAFEELVGSHGGLGGGQAHPFVLAPGDLSWPEGEVVGAEAVHRVLRGWLAGLGHAEYEDV